MNALTVARNAPTNPESAAQPVLIAAKEVDTASPAATATQPDVAKMVTMVAKETLVALLVKAAAPAEDAASLDTIAPWSTVNVGAARTARSALAIILVFAPYPTTLSAPERTSAARRETNVIGTPTALPRAAPRRTALPPSTNPFKVTTVKVPPSLITFLVFRFPSSSFEFTFFRDLFI